MSAMWVITNAIANVIITLSVAIFMVFVFGRSTMISKVHWVERFVIKSGLALLSAGSLFNFFTLSSPAISEVILNIGLAVVFSWGAYFHFRYFVKK